MKNNKRKVFTILALASTVLLASCNETIYSRPTDDVKDQTLINNSNVDHNTVEWLYDTLHDTSTTPEKVRDAMFKVLENGLFGDFSFSETGEVKITGYDDVTDSEKLNFIKLHKTYWDQGAKEGSTKYEYKEPTALTDSIKARVDLFKSIVKKQVVITLFNKANSDSFKKRSYFYEVKFARNISKDLYKITGVTDIYDEKYDKEDSSIFTNKVLLDESVSTENIDSIIGTDNSLGKPILHLALYSDYINNNILPDIMENLLVEQYVYDNQYTAISRTQSRKLRYISISTENKNVSDARRLINTFVDTYIGNSTANKEIDYDILANAWKGVYDNLFTNGVANDSAKLLQNSGFTIGTPSKDGTSIQMFADGKLPSEHPYFKNTKYGDLIEDFAKITLNPKTTDSTVESTFTNSGSYSIETGLDIKTNDITITDLTTYAWGTKDNGFSSLPSDVKTRLFDYTVMTDFNAPANIDDNSYLKAINGHYFLKRNVSQTDQLSDSIVIKDSSTFYIVELLEAPSQAKLTIGGENAYDNTATSGLKQEEISRTLGYDIASGTTYKTTAFTHYLEDCEINYNDQSVYDYFKTTYPDLFKN
jgi:hypothetical protein